MPLHVSIFVALADRKLSLSETVEVLGFFYSMGTKTHQGGSAQIILIRDRVYSASPTVFDQNVGEKIPTAQFEHPLYPLIHTGLKRG